MSSDYNHPEKTLLADERQRQQQASKPSTTTHADELLDRMEAGLVVPSTSVSATEATAEGRMGSKSSVSFSSKHPDKAEIKKTMKDLERFREAKRFELENAQKSLDLHNLNVLDRARQRTERWGKKLNEPWKNTFIPGRKGRAERELKQAKVDFANAWAQAEVLTERVRRAEKEFENAWETSPFEKQMIRDLAHDVACLLNENRMGFGCGKFMDCFVGFIIITPLLWTIGMVLSAAAFTYFIVRRITRPFLSRKQSYSPWCFSEAKSRAGKSIFRLIALEQVLDRLFLLSRSPKIIANILELRRVAKRAKKMCAPAADSIYLLSEEVLQTCNNGFPKFEDAINRGLLTKIPVEFLRNPSKAKVLFHPKADIILVSHKWFGMDPDPNHQVCERVRRMDKTQDKFESLVNDDLSWVGEAYKRVEGRPYVWFDYTCVPQNKEDENKRARFLRTIPEIVVHSGFARVHGYVELQNQYESSIWCMLESILATYPPLFRPLSREKDKHFFKDKDKTEWTIADKSDLYQVLPGFLYYLCSNPDLLISLLTEKARRKTVISILEMFVQFHDENSPVSSPSHPTTSGMILQPSMLPSLTSLSPPSPGGRGVGASTNPVMIAPSSTVPDDGIEYAVVVPSPFDYVYQHPSPFTSH